MTRQTIPAIQATGLKKSFRGNPAVCGVDLHVEQGDIVALLGPNGAGKTTTLMMLLGVTEPDSGEVRILGHRLPHERTAALERTNFAATYLGMPDRIRVRQLLDVFAGLYRAPRSRINEVIELFGLQDLAGRYASQLSSGQKTLVVLAKSLLNHPRLLVLDEPTASLDPEMAVRVRDTLVAAQAEDGFTMLVTSHNMAEVERLARRVVFISRGLIVADGSPSEIAARYGAAGLEETFISIAAEARG